jgi:hypothetical protein
MELELLPDVELPDAELLVPEVPVGRATFART